MGGVTLADVVESAVGDAGFLVPAGEDCSGVVAHFEGYCEPL
jgi:hypothetical protein